MTEDRYLVLYWIVAGNIRSGSFTVRDDNYALLSWIDSHRASILDGSTVIDQITRINEPLDRALTQEDPYDQRVFYLTDEGIKVTGFVKLLDAQSLIYRRGTFTIAVHDPAKNGLVYVDSTRVDLVL